METYLIKGKNGFVRRLYFEWNGGNGEARITREAVDHLEVIECSRSEALRTLYDVIGEQLRLGFSVERISS